MRLKSIEIENITSLKGKHYIDFEDILKEGELFAITGPTGSGKSSILTAISLALYGKNYKKSLDSKDFVTLNMPSSKVSLNFETKGENYCASWSIKVLKKNGGPIKKPTTQRIVTKDGVAIEQSAEEIIGLSFDQFIRSVILNQGQFSKFLTSNFSERRKILERLYSENELSDINKKLREKLSYQKQEIEKLSIKLESSLPYTEAEILEAKSQLPELEKSKGVVGENYKKIQEFEKQLRDILEFSSKRIQFLRKSKDIDLNITDVNKNLNNVLDNLKGATSTYDAFKLEYNIRGKKLKEALTLSAKLNNTREKIATLKSNKEKLEEKFKKIEIEISTKSKEQNELTKEREEIDKKITYKDIESIDKVNDLLNDLSNTLQKIDYERESHKALEEELKAITKNGEELAKQKNTQESNLKEIFKTLDFESFYAEKSKHLDTRLSELEKQKLLLQQDEQKKIELEKKLKSINIEKVEEQISEVEKKLYNIEKELTLAIIKEKQYKKNEALLILVNESIDDSTCKLCHGKVEVDLLESIKKDIIKELKNNEGLISTDNIRELVANENQKRTVLKYELENLSKQRSENLELLKPLEERVKGLESATNEIQDITKEKEVLSKSYESARSLAKSLIITENEIKSLRLSYTKTKSNIDAIESKIKALDKESADHLKQLSKLAHSEIQIDAINELKQQIKAINELNQIEQKYKYNQSHLDSLNEQTLELNEDKKSTLSNLDTLKEDEVEQEKTLLDLTNGEDINSALKELESKREELEENIQKINKEKSTLETEYTRLLTSKDSLKDQITALENSTISAYGNLANTNLKTTELVSKNKETEIYISKVKNLKTYIDDEASVQGLKDAREKLLLPELEYFRDTLNEILTQVTKSKEKISLYESKVKEQKEDKKLYKEYRASFDRLNNLTEVLGKNKDEFRNFVLGFIENQLIQNTNLELSKICDGRYGLTQRESTHGHDFFILDKWNGALERKVSTLSGGETFLVSLAMALSLAEMTRGQVDIDCFFIDEGFGSLDSDSIEDAFSALMSVRSRGKQIGVISHIGELTSRIPANINLNKSPEGRSKIEYIFN
ncbi:SbcC/MukB-like Walker B domain-containing protein [Halobacteriovorax marinus]|uniref:SbcC/MukB-like Walker B domain-containing protein n=1 Tax=Halobacteriovorax marinus TaxID=97084 RepID=UPI003A8DF756